MTVSFPLMTLDKFLIVLGAMLPLIMLLSGLTIQVGVWIWRFVDDRESNPLNPLTKLYVRLPFVGRVRQLNGKYYALSSRDFPIVGDLHLFDADGDQKDTLRKTIEQAAQRVGRNSIYSFDSRDAALAAVESGLRKYPVEHAFLHLGRAINVCFLFGVAGLIAKVSLTLALILVALPSSLLGLRKMRRFQKEVKAHLADKSIHTAQAEEAGA